jgi:crotonobetainyl-CoA:carnitine CoA-transferase CaiB-like acyl-CoA transferase
LDGVRVADFSHIMAGPFASHYLALLGAEVIKIEPPGRGDAMRYYGADRRYDGMAPAFIAANAGKKSIQLDLKKPEAIEAAKRLIAASDVVLENFRPGVMARLGLGYEACKALREDIIFCSVSGYGQEGPLANYPAIDNIVQASSGMMSLGGEPGGPPMRVGFPAIDTWTGQTAALAIMTALFHRERTGLGQKIDVAMFDAALVFMASAGAPYLITGQALERTGNTGYSGQPTSAMFVAGDGVNVSLGVVQQNQYESLCRAMAREDLIADPRFVDPDLRRENGAALQAEVSKTFATKTAEEWERILNTAGAPCAVVRDIPSVFAMPHLKDRNVVLPVRIEGLPEKDDVAVLGTGFAFAHDGPDNAAPPPRLGQDTDAVLTELGFDQAEREKIAAPR